jgi:acyl carrier protein
MENIEKKVIEILKKELLTDNIDVNSTYENTSGWDSQFFLVLIMSIEEEFNILIPNEMLDKLVSVKSISKLVRDLI